MKNLENIQTVFDQLLQRSDKELLLKQKAKVIWLTGLSGSGKTTLATALEKALYEAGFLTQVLDGDNVRSGINNNLGFTESERTENIRRIAEISKLFLNCGVICINCFISPTKAMRTLAKKIIGEDDFIEIYVNTPLELCEKRDVKGLYAKARRGEIQNFTGIDAVYETPQGVKEISTAQTLEASLEDLLNYILPKIKV